MNEYLQNYIDGFIKTFRAYNNHAFSLTIFGFSAFVPKNDAAFQDLIDLLKSHEIDIRFEGDENSIDSVMVFYTDINDGKSGYYNCCIDNLPLLIELSSKTDVSFAAIIVMKVISQLVCREKTLYKALVLDLDGTLWDGILAEEGIEVIQHRLCTKESAPFLYFMRFVSVLAKALGIFVAICSRNNSETVQSAIEILDESVFPIKDQIDCIVANSNKKSDNLKAIADELSILPQAMVFIDDNKIIRDEVRETMPEVFVPEWSNHYDLVTLLITICAFERLDLSKNAQNRKGRNKILNAARSQAYRPALKIAMAIDENHSDAKKLYAKTNQFIFNKNPILPGSTSIIFTLFRENGEEIGLCSSLTYIIEESKFRVINWAISCAFFGIGLEEFILLYIIKLATNYKLCLCYEDCGYNLKAKEFLTRYSNCFVKKDCGNEIVVSNMNLLIDIFNKNTKLEGR